MLAGLSLPVTANDDRQYLVDLGLLKRPQGGDLAVANPIYREVLLRCSQALPIEERLVVETVVSKRQGAITVIRA